MLLFSYLSLVIGLKYLYQLLHKAETKTESCIYDDVTQVLL